MPKEKVLTKKGNKRLFIFGFFIDIFFDEMTFLSSILVIHEKISQMEKKKLTSKTYMSNDIKWMVSQSTFRV